MTYQQAVKVSMEKFAQLEKSIFVGYNLKYGSKSYGTLSNVLEEQIMEMPVAEQLMTGVATGLALQGFKPMLVFERQDFLLLASDQLINHLSKIKKMSKEEYNPKVVIRAIIGGTKPFHPGPQHIQDFTDIFEEHSEFKVFKPNKSEEVLEAYDYALSCEESVFVSEKRDFYNDD